MPLTTYTAGEVLTAASLNDNFAYAASGGLTFIATGTVTAGSALSFNNCFSATYTNYLITINVSAGTVLSLRLRASGTDISAANYFVAGSYIASGAQTLINLTAQTSMKLSNGGNPVNVISTVCNPFAAFNTTFTNASQRADSGTFEATGCLYNASTSADGFTVRGTTMTATASVYGYAIS